MTVPHSPAVEARIAEIAYKHAYCDEPYAFDSCYDAIKEALKDPAILAAIWPSEPTEGMIVAGHEAMADGRAYDVYKAMRDAWVAGRK